jgi:hypothetical protein
MISILDGQGAMIDTQEAFAGAVDLDVSTTIDLKKKIGIGGHNSAILAGILDGARSVVVSADGITPYEGILSPSGIADAISLDAPQRIHILEDAPYAVHEVDSHGIPLKKINMTGISSTPGAALSGGRIVIERSGTEDLAVLSRLGADSKRVEAFANHMSLHITSQGTTDRVGKDFEITAHTDARDVQLLIESPFPYRKISEGTFAITPNIEGNFNITVTALKKGYGDARATFAVNAEKIFKIVVNAVDSTGEALRVYSTIKADGFSKNHVTPHEYEVRPQFISVEFPETFETGQIGYRLDHVVLNGQRTTNSAVEQIYIDSETAITAGYQKLVRIQAENALGSGHYPYGTAVTLSVPPKDRALFFVRDVFDHWEGISYDSDTVTLIATDNIDAKAILREDYSILMLTCGAALTVAVYFRYVWKKGISPFWYAHKLGDRMRISGVLALWQRLTRKVRKPKQTPMPHKGEIDF